MLFSLATWSLGLVNWFTFSLLPWDNSNNMPPALSPHLMATTRQWTILNSLHRGGDVRSGNQKVMLGTALTCCLSYWASLQQVVRSTLLPTHFELFFFLLFCLFLFFSLLIDHSFFLSKSQPTKDICERIFCSYPGIKKLCDTQLYACMWFTPFRRPLWLLSHLHKQTYIAFDLVTCCDLAH